MAKFSVGQKAFVNPLYFQDKKGTASLWTITNLQFNDDCLEACLSNGNITLSNVNVLWLNRDESRSKFKSKFTPQQRAEIRKQYETGYGICFLARKYNCWPNAIWNIVYDLSKPIKASEKEKKLFLKNSKLTEKNVLEIRKLAKHGSPYIAKKFNISQTTALGIMNGKTYRWVKGETVKGTLEPIEVARVRRKTDMKPGSKPGVKKTVARGALIKLAKKHGVKPCTIRRWILKGKIKKPPLKNKTN